MHSPHLSAAVRAEVVMQSQPVAASSAEKCMTMLRIPMRLVLIPVMLLIMACLSVVLWISMILSLMRVMLIAFRFFWLPYFLYNYLAKTPEQERTAYIHEEP
jgi:hypothetical protein